MYVYVCTWAFSVLLFMFSPAVLLQAMIVIIINMFVGMIVYPAEACTDRELAA